MSRIRELLERNRVSLDELISSAEQMRDDEKIKLEAANKEVKRLVSRVRELTAAAEWFKSVRSEHLSLSSPDTSIETAPVQLAASIRPAKRAAAGQESQRS